MNFTDEERKQRLGEILKDIHSKIPNSKKDFSKVGNYEFKTGSINGEKIKRVIIYLRSSGCEWMLNDENGGCSICGHIAGTANGRRVEAESYIKQFDEIISEIDLAGVRMISVYNAGSFFNDNEIPEKARIHIFKKISELNQIETVIFESRPEYISEDKMSIMKDILYDKRVEIGVGLESSDAYIREMCVNKGFKADDFYNASKIMKNNNVYLLVYVLQKPPFVSEKLAIKDSVNTIKWAFENGADIISLEPVSVQKNTLINLLYKMGLYRPSWIWSVVEVIKNVSDLGLVRVGGFEFFPTADIFTHNCPECDEEYIDAIESYNATNKLDKILEALEHPCTRCYSEWKSALSGNSSVRDNIDTFLNAFDKEKLNFYL